MKETLAWILSVIGVAGLVMMPFAIPLFWAKLNKIELILQEGAEHE